MSGDVTQPIESASRSRRLLLGIFVAGLVLALMAVGLFAGWLTLSVVRGTYDQRIYPNVHVLDVDVGGLTRQEARARLTGQLGGFESATLVLRDGERRWSIPWSELGLEVGVEDTVYVAFAAGRSDPSVWTFPRFWLGRHQVAPVFVVDAGEARAALEQLAPEMAIPPEDATLRLEGDQLVAVPGQPGRELDVDATLNDILALASPFSQNELVPTFQQIPPRIADASPARDQAEGMLNRRLEVTTYDVLTDETFSWALGRDVLVTWLEVRPAEDTADLVVSADPEAVQRTLDNLAVELGEGRGFRLEEAAQEVARAFEAGEESVDLYMTHPQRTYTVQSGDRLSTIAADFGVPPGLIAEANPDLDLNWLHVGDRITIPSQDVLTPYKPVPGKRIVISIDEQRMRVYERGQVIYDWPVSTGIPSSPTYTGVFQVLSKEENAYAAQWDLWMGHFIAIYRAGADVYNGIHALPVLSSGQRLWAGLLGSPASYGCIILGIEEAETLYQWADIGVLVIIE